MFFPVPCQSLHPAASTAPHTHPLHLVPYCWAGPLRKRPSSVRPASEPARFEQARFIIDPVQADPLRDRPGSGRPAFAISSHLSLGQPPEPRRVAASVPSPLYASFGVRRPAAGPPPCRPVRLGLGQGQAVSPVSQPAPQRRGSAPARAYQARKRGGRASEKDDEPRPRHIHADKAPPAPPRPSGTLPPPPRPAPSSCQSPRPSRANFCSIPPAAAPSAPHPARNPTIPPLQQTGPRSAGSQQQGGASPV